MNDTMKTSNDQPIPVRVQPVVGRLAAKECKAVGLALKLKRDGLEPVEAEFVMACLKLKRPLETAAAKLGWTEPPNSAICQPDAVKPL
jgi:hypothetical protein